MSVKSFSGNSSLATRASVLDKLASEETFISVHEHLLQEDIYVNNRHIQYSQDIHQFHDEFKIIEGRNFGGYEPTLYAASFFSTTVRDSFRAFPFANRNDYEQDMYYINNYRTFEQVGLYQSVAMKSKSETKFLPMPILFIDPNQKVDTFIKRYNAILPYTCGFKWHPFAQNTHAKRYIQAGYMDLAAEYNLPILIHSEAPGEKGDIVSLTKTVSHVAETKNVAVNFAHLGYMHPCVEIIKGHATTYTDISPWCSICDRNGLTERNQKIDKLHEYVDKLGNKMLLGFDSPFTASIRGSGQKWGNTITEEIDFYQAFFDTCKTDIVKKLMHINPNRYLKSLPSIT